MRSQRKFRSAMVDRKIVESLISGKGVNEIARDMRVGKARIRKLRDLAEEAGFLGGRVPLPPYPAHLFPTVVCPKSRGSEADRLLQTVLPWIQERIAAEWHGITIFEQLPVRVSQSSFYRFLERHRLTPLCKRPSRVVPEIVHEPGETLQVDWGKLRMVECPDTGRKVTLWAFVGVLGYSRYRMVRLTTRLDQDSTLSLLESMLLEIGGAPKKVTSDNPKVFAIKACRYEPLVHPVYERFASYYGLTVECLPPADPRKKGKVERPMPFIRRLMEPFAGDWNDTDAAQKFLDHQLSLANDRCHGTTGEKPIERLLTEEVAALKPLPKLLWEREEYHEGTVRKDGHVRFRGKYYSVPETLIGEDVQLVGNASTIWIYHNGQLIETHGRCHDRRRYKATKPEHLKPWERSMQETSIYRDRARTIGADADEFVVRVIGNGLGVIDFRKVWGLLSLDKTYSHAEINRACRQALETGSTSLRVVRSFLSAKELEPSTSGSEPWPIESEDQATQKRTNRFIRSISEYGAVVASSQIAKEKLH